MMPIARLTSLALLAACAVALSGTLARAEPLESEVCKDLESQRQQLLTRDVQAALARGPDWVKEHLHDFEEIEKVRQFLVVEENIKFRCRTDGVRIPEPKPMPLPDRKPAIPLYGKEVVAGADATLFMPLRKPTAAERAAAEAAAAEAEANGEADADAEGEVPGETGAGDAEEVSSAAAPEIAQPGPSQTVADSDKTAPSVTKATR